jgi:CubicO group peptidase (beta-lactamase class C family)
LGITNYEWRTDSHGMVNADHGLHMRPRDMLKLGVLFLNRGLWTSGERLVSEDWVERATRRHVPLSGSHGYGYQWWSATSRDTAPATSFFLASGNGGQRIQVFPTLDAVLVFTGHYYDQADVSDALLARILPAIRP